MAGNNHAIANLRKPYLTPSSQFVESHIVSNNPFSLFDNWFKLACDSDKVYEASAMTLATATCDGRPSCRMLLLKGYDDQGFCFYTNYESRKARELEENPQGCLMFYWERLHRMVRIEGKLLKLSELEADEYFATRPRTSQLSAWASPQSSVVSSRDELLRRKTEAEQKFEGIDVPRPPFWGGYRLVPDAFEFWQGQSDRLHDRIRFRREDDSEEQYSSKSQEKENNWIYERLGS